MGSTERVVEVLSVANFDRIGSLVRPRRFAAAVEKVPERRKMIETVAAFVEADATARLNQRDAGEVYFRLTSLPIEQLHEFLTEYAKQTGVPGPKALDHGGKRGRPISVGVKILADVIYGKHPEFLRRSGKSSTLAAKSIDACIRKYKKSAGLMKGGNGRKKPWPAKVPRSGRQMMEDLFEAAAGKQHHLLEGLIKLAWGVGALAQLRRLVGSAQAA